MGMQDTGQPQQKLAGVIEEEMHHLVEIASRVEARGEGIRARVVGPRETVDHPEEGMTSKVTQELALLDRYNNILQRLKLTLFAIEGDLEAMDSKV